MSTKTDLLAELEQRAGASDKHRELWLAERRTGITATEVRDLYLRKVTVQQLIDSKLGRTTDAFSGNRYTAWGNTREPILADEMFAVYGIRPESRVFHATDNPRFLASPDGVGVVDGELVVEEIKTGKDYLGTDGPAYRSKGYEIQQQWSMRVTGARKSLYVPEQHDSDWQDRGGEFEEPAPLNLFVEPEWVEYDAALARELEVLATGFLVALDAARAGEVPQYDDELDTMAVNLLRFREMESEGKKAKEQAWAQLQQSLRAQHDELSQESPLARITWRAAGTHRVVEQVEVPTVDEAAAKAAQPMAWTHLELCRAELADAEKALAEAEAEWAAHLKKHTTVSVESVARDEPTKESLTVTAVKPKKGTSK